MKSFSTRTEHPSGRTRRNKPGDKKLWKLIREEGSKGKGMLLLIVIEEGTNSGSFIFLPNFRIILGQSIIPSIDFSGNICAQREVYVTYLLRKGLWQEGCCLCWSMLLKCS